MSYSIGDESDDELSSNSARLHPAGASAGGPGPSSSSSSSSRHAPAAASGGISRQSHVYADPFSDEHGSSSHHDDYDGHAGGGGGGYTDSLIYDDYSGGQSANPLGTATEVSRGPGLGSDTIGRSYNRYDVYEE